MWSRTEVTEDRTRLGCLLCATPRAGCCHMHPPGLLPMSPARLGVLVPWGSCCIPRAYKHREHPLPPPSWVSRGTRPQSWVQSPLGLFLASPPLTCPPFLSLCSYSLSLNPESWTGEREGGWGRVTNDCGEGQGGRGCEPDQRAARACPWSHTGGHNIELLPSLSAPLEPPRPA